MPKPIDKNTFKFKKKLLYFLSVVITPIFGVAQNPQGFFLDDWQPLSTTSPGYINTAQTTATPTVTVTVDMNNVLTKVSKYVFGNNAINWAGKMNTVTSLVKNINNLNPHILRWPGGNLSNEYFWDAVEGKGPTDIPPTMKIEATNAGRNTTNWAMTVDNYYELLTKTNTTGCICVNYSYARYGTSADPVANAAHYAANWVRYDKGRTKYWEIGNENMGNWEAGYQIDTTLNKDHQPKIITGKLYGQHCRIFIDSMKSAASEIGSDIKIGVVMMESTATWDTVMLNWNRQMIPLVADKADFMIVHSYYTPYNENSTIQTILNSAAYTKGYKDYVLNDLKTYAGKNNLPVALTEWNIFAVGSKQMVSYINGMHATLVLGELIKNQFGEATRWDLANGWSNGDDHGLFAGSGEPGVTQWTPHAPFYYMYFFQRFFGDNLVSSAVSGNSNIVAYASSFSSGQSGIVVVNKGTSSQVVNLQMNNFNNAKSYYRYLLTGGTDNGNFSRKVYVNGQGSSGDGGGPANYQTIKAFGTAIDGAVKFETPALSVSYILVSSDSIPSLTNADTYKSPSFEIYPNPATDKVTIFGQGGKIQKVEIVNVNGESVLMQIFDSYSSDPASLDLKLEPGFYFVNVYQDNIKSTRKLIVK
jgi:hypothetical protein